VNNHTAGRSFGTLPEKNSTDPSRLKTVIVFSLDGQPFGIDINLVHSFIPDGPHTPVRDIHPGLTGFFSLDGSAIPLLNMAYLLEKNEPRPTKTVIFSELNQFLFAFPVDSIDGIYEISLHSRTAAGPLHHVPGLPLNGGNILLPDFQELTHGIIRTIRQRQAATRKEKDLLLVHNSAVLREVLTGALRAGGYCKLTELDDTGKAAPYLLEKYTAGCLPDLLIIGSTGQPPLAGLQALIAAIKAVLRFRFLPVILLTDRYDRPRHPAINAQISPFDHASLIVHCDALTDTLRIHP